MRVELSNTPTISNFLRFTPELASVVAFYGSWGEFVAGLWATNPEFTSELYARYVGVMDHHPSRYTNNLSATPETTLTTSFSLNSGPGHSRFPDDGPIQCT